MVFLFIFCRPFCEASKRSRICKPLAVRTAPSSVQCVLIADRGFTRAGSRGGAAIGHLLRLSGVGTHLKTRATFFVDFLFCIYVSTLTSAGQNEHQSKVHAQLRFDKYVFSSSLKKNGVFPSVLTVFFFVAKCRRQCRCCRISRTKIEWLLSKKQSRVSLTRWPKKFVAKDCLSKPTLKRSLGTA